MNTPARLRLSAVAACALIGTLTGCTAGTSVVTPSDPPSSIAATTSAPPASPSASPSPTATRTAAADATPTAAPDAAPSGPSLAQHVFDECSTGAAENGVTLTFTEDLNGYTGADGDYHLVYPFTFDDGHSDPYAVYNCALTDDTVHSSYLGGGLTDSH
jgi:hypothetical protein